MDVEVGKDGIVVNLKIFVADIASAQNGGTVAGKGIVLEAKAVAPHALPQWIQGRLKQQGLDIEPEALAQVILVYYRFIFDKGDYLSTQNNYILFSKENEDRGRNTNTKE